MRAALILAGVGALGFAWWHRRQVAAQVEAESPAEVAQDVDAWNIDNLTEEVTAMLPTEDAPTTDQAEANVAAFLQAIRAAEGTAGPDGYRTLFGGRLFSSFADHPRQPAQFTNRNGERLWTSAAGAYQFMAVSPLPTGGSTRVDTWDRLQRKLGLPDFSPESQDRAAVALIDEAGALADVRAGRFADAVAKVRRIWASMPGAGYAQGERTLEWLAQRYTDAGGLVA